VDNTTQTGQDPAQKRVADQNFVQDNMIDQVLNPYNSIYLHPWENPGLILVKQTFNEKNYSSWSRNLKRTLVSKSKIKFVDGNTKASKEMIPCTMHGKYQWFYLGSLRLYHVYVENVKDFYDELT